MTRLADDVAMITGGGAGIGRATARLFAAEGARVAVADVDAEAAATTVKIIRESGYQARTVALDVRDGAIVTAAFEAVEQSFGPVSILVNCAGGSRDDDAPLHALSEDTIDATVGLDLRGTLLCCRAALGQMRRAGGGAIVNFASYHALGGDSPVHAYSAAKGGVLAATRAMAASYAADGIRVNAISPGIVLTERVANRIERTHTDLTDIRYSHPHAVGAPEDVARIALFLASSDAQLITGSTLAADGGLSLF